jgi:hypothetical protein
MANPNAPFGLRPLKRRDGAPWSGGPLTERKIVNAFATAIFRGDLVKQAATGYIQRSAAGDAIRLGVFWGCRYYDLTAARWVYSKHYPASAPASGDPIAQVITDPELLFEIMSSAGPTAFADLGANADIVATAGSTLDGQSDEVLDNATVAVTATLPLRIWEQQLAVDNDNLSANNRIIVALNGADAASTTGL